jgi:transglutaminase-like putative cysteine protease
MLMPMLGVNLEMLACDEACARGPDQSSDVLERTLAPAPHALEPALLNGAARYALVVDNDAVKSLPTTGEQAAKALGEHRYELEIDALPVAGREKAAEPADSQPTRWLQSDAPELRKLLAQAGAESAAPRERMKTLEGFVRGYIRNKSLRVGYASALETVKSREGDCTEHALLLAALGRAAGIPTRVVNGLAYTQRFNGRDNVFVPHAWAQAYVDGKWQSFDAALGGFDTGHIALSYGDGDPAGFYAGVNLLGQVRVESVEAVAKP